MRRSVLAVALVALVLLAGCDFSPGGSLEGTETAAGPEATTDRPDPEADPEAGEDPLGWEDGYWYDDPLSVTTEDGLNASERTAVIARAKARVEQIRRLEFEGNVSVSVVGSENYSLGGGGETSEALRTFDNAKFEAMFLVGERSDSIAVQRTSRNQTTGGFYNSRRDAIVIRADTDRPELPGETTLGHELVHALQDQHFNVTTGDARTRDGVNGALALIEGDARTVELAYRQRCEGEWSCVSPPENDGEGSGSGPDNFGPYLLKFFPYADGVGLVASLRDGDDWSAVNDAFDSLPDSAAEVIDPATYGEFERADVALDDRTRAGWTRVRPPDRPDYGVVGRSGLGAMFGRTLYDDYNESAAIDPGSFLNAELGGVNRSDPLNYDLAATRGWTGDRIHVYERGDETAYVWRLTWRSPEAAQRFAAGYRAVLGHWRIDRVGDDVWVAEEGPFADAYRLTVDGDTVTITNAPTRATLGEVWRPR